jgi:hypothetical protein
MNIVLWVLQIALAWMCIAGGFFQIFKLEDLKKGVASMRELPKGVWVCMGALGCLLGLGLVVPGALSLTGITAIAAAAVAAHSLVISAFYVRFKDFEPMKYSMTMAVVAALIAVGRFALAPV